MMNGFAKCTLTVAAVLVCSAVAGFAQDRSSSGRAVGVSPLNGRSTEHSGSQPRGTSLRPLVSFVGADTRITERQWLRLGNRHDWELLWLRHAGMSGSPEDYNQYRRTGAPEVDFDQCMVIAITESPGLLNAGIKAVSISETDEQITFDYDDMFYQAREGTSAPGNAYGYFVLPQSTKPVAVRHNVQEGRTRYTGGPPVWSEVARFDALE